MGRVNVFLNDELLQKINEEAKKENTNRGAIIQTALEMYIEAKQRDCAEGEKRKKIQEAARKIDALAKKLGKWNAQKIIRKHRESNLKAR